MALFKHLSPDDKALSNYIHSILGFRPKNIALYQLAFTHKSKADESLGDYRLNNERLEYLGDAVLDFVVGDYVFHKYPTQPEGFLTDMRSRIVSRASLNRLAQKFGFEEHIKYRQQGHFTEGSFSSLGGNTFEALIGAIYLDRGFPFTQRIIVNRIIKIHIDIDQLEETDINYKGRLLEWVQKQHKTLEYRVLEEKMENHRKIYHVQVFIDNKGYADYSDFSMRRAEKNAAEKTYKILTN